MTTKNPFIKERHRQYQAALDLSATVYRYHYTCDDGEAFSAIAPSEDGAFRVLNAERPGMLAEYTAREIVYAAAQEEI